MDEKRVSVGARVTQEAAAGQAAAAIRSMPSSLSQFRCPLDGRVFDSELHELPELPGDAHSSFLKARYKWIELPETEFVVNGAYVGTRDADGNWLFRIYNPKYASDGRPGSWW